MTTGNDAKVVPNSSSLLMKDLFLLPVCFNERQEGIQELISLQENIDHVDDLQQFATKLLRNERYDTRYCLVLLGSSQDELKKEMEKGIQNLEGAKADKEWQTPTGSYFTPAPLGGNEKIAFVYPGAFGTYIGMGKDLFNLFPQLHDAMHILTDDSDQALNADIIYPDSLDPVVIDSLQKQLDRSPTTMISTGACFSYLFTCILRDIFNVKPDVTFGYSLGEESMMFAAGIWTQVDAMRTSLETSPIFQERVAGKKKAIRDYWGLSEHEEEDSIWSNYVLMAPYEQVKEAIKPSDHAYITHINTSRQVVIGGDDETCQRIANDLKCMYLKTTYDHAIHCAPVQSEFEAFKRLHYWPVEYEPHIPVYSAANYEPMTLESRAISGDFAHMLTHPIDFPRLVNAVYEDGARIFIELGAGSNCSKWIDVILKDQPHGSFTINQKNVSDPISILRLLAKLVSHRVPVNLLALTE